MKSSGLLDFAYAVDRLELDFREVDSPVGKKFAGRTWSCQNYPLKEDTF